MEEIIPSMILLSSGIPFIVLRGLSTLRREKRREFVLVCKESRC